MKVHFRPCKPSDADRIVPYILYSGPDAFGYVFTTANTTARDFLMYAFSKKGGQFSFQNHTAIIHQNSIIGVGGVFDAKKAASFTFKDVIRILIHYKWRSIPVLIRGLKIEQCLQLPVKNEICLVHLGVSKGQRGQGLGTLLIAHLMEKFQDRSKGVFVLDVSTENPKAQQLYKRLGFKTTKLVPSTLKSPFGYVPSHYRMERPVRL